MPYKVTGNREEFEISLHYFSRKWPTRARLNLYICFNTLIQVVYAFSTPPPHYLPCSNTPWDATMIM
jgi:hypothetical protein